MVFDISKKSKYAFAALIELAHRGPERPINARALALRHQMPLRFLEIILNELKQGGFVRSIRGKMGGYVLARPAEQITAAQVLYFLELNANDADTLAEPSATGAWVVQSLVQQANAAVAQVFEACTLHSLAQQEQQHRAEIAPNYVI